METVYPPPIDVTAPATGRFILALPIHTDSGETDPWFWKAVEDRLTFIAAQKITRTTADGREYSVRQYAYRDPEREYLEGPQYQGEATRRVVEIYLINTRDAEVGEHVYLKAFASPDGLDAPRHYDRVFLPWDGSEDRIFQHEDGGWKRVK